MIWLPDVYMTRLRRMQAGLMAKAGSDSPGTVFNFQTRRLVSTPVPLPVHGKYPCEAGGIAFEYHRWCVAYATVRLEDGKAVCPVHAIDRNYRPADLRGRFPRWMATEVFLKSGQMRRQGPRGHRHATFTKVNPKVATHLKWAVGGGR